MMSPLQAHPTRSTLRRSGHLAVFALLAALLPPPLFAKVVVFWQADFPTVASQPVERIALTGALDGLDPQFADLASLKGAATLSGADLLILPYGSAVPTDAWPSIVQYLRGGGNLLILGGQPLRVPVTSVNGRFVASRPQGSYSRVLDFHHTY